MFPDISEYQGAVDWNALGAAYQAGQIEAVAIRAGFGTIRADRQFAANQAVVRIYGIPAIYYWFNYPTYNDPQAEAAMFNATVGPLGPSEAMCGDFEDDAASGSIFPRGQAGVDWAKAFLTALEAPQNATWWYTYPYLLSVIPFQQLYGVWPFWLADYSITPDSAFPIPIARQFTNCGSTPGVNGCCDQSRVLKAPLSQWLTLSKPSEVQEKMLICNSSAGQFLLSGSLYAHIPDSPTVQALLAAGVQQANISDGLHAELVAAQAEPAKVSGSVTGSFTGSIS